MHAIDNWYRISTEDLGAFIWTGNVAAVPTPSEDAQGDLRRRLDGVSTPAGKSRIIQDKSKIRLSVEQYPRQE
jgi:hypothetical protein